MTRKTLALTGATGFVGKTLIKIARARGWHLRALTRRDQPPEDGITWIEGALNQPERLVMLATGADVVVHVAGVVNAPTKEEFEAGNVAGTIAMVQAARSAGVERFIHISSLAAREPQLSIYGATKARAEHIVQASSLDWTIIRPPGIYGPDDRDHLELFKMAKSGWMMMPPKGRLSVIAVGDLCRLILDVIPILDTRAQIYEPDDGRDNGWSHEGFAKAIGWAVDRRVSIIHMPTFALRLAARLDRLFRREKARLTLDRVGYMCHPNWVADKDRVPPTSLWTAEINTQAGLKATGKAYRAKGWL